MTDQDRPNPRRHAGHACSDRIPLDRIDARLDRIDGNLAAMRTDIDAVNGKIDTWPDFHFLAAT